MKTLTIAVFGCVEGEPLRLQKLELGAGEGGPASWPAPCKYSDGPFWDAQTDHLSGGPADPDVTRWGGGRSPVTGLAASDKNPPGRIC